MLPAADGPRHRARGRDAAKIAKRPPKYGPVAEMKDLRSGFRTREAALMSDHGSSAKAILYAFVANLGIALAKLGASIYTGSGSMLAEAIHSFADCGNQVLLFIGLRQAQRPPDATYPLGYGRSRTSGVSWSRCCCSRWVACSPSTKAGTNFRPTSR
jgi:hypothetical protein